MAKTPVLILLLASILAVAPAVWADEDLFALLKDRSSEAPFCIYCGLGNTRIVCNVAEDGGLTFQDSIALPSCSAIGADGCPQRFVTSDGVYRLAKISSNPVDTSGIADC
ncbi:hypothetical protein N2152v2_009767 [Parachlorella kessleri]